MVPDRFVKKNRGENWRWKRKHRHKNTLKEFGNPRYKFTVWLRFWSSGDFQRLLDYTLFTHKTRNAEFKPPHHRKQHTISFWNFFNSKKCKENAQKPTYNHAINYRRDNFLIRLASPGSVYAQCELHVFQVNTSQASATRLATLSVDSKQLTVTQPPTHAASRPLIGHQVLEVPPFSQLAPPIAVSTNQRMGKGTKTSNFVVRKKQWMDTVIRRVKVQTSRADRYGKRSSKKMKGCSTLPWRMPLVSINVPVEGRESTGYKSCNAMNKIIANLLWNRVHKSPSNSKIFHDMCADVAGHISQQ